MTTLCGLLVHQIFQRFNWGCDKPGAKVKVKGTKAPSFTKPSQGALGPWSMACMTYIWYEYSINIV